MIGLRPWLLLPIFFIFWPHHVAYETLVPQPGIELPALAASNLSHWATRLAPFTAFKDKLPHYSLADLRQVWGALHQTPWLPLPPHSEEPGEHRASPGTTQRPVRVKPLVTLALGLQMITKRRPWKAGRRKQVSASETSMQSSKLHQG